MTGSLWPYISSVLEQENLPLVHSLWIAPIRASENEDGSLTLACPNEFILDQVQAQYLPRIRQLASERAGRDVPVKAVCVPASPPENRPAAVPPALAPAAAFDREVWASVVEGPENAFAWQALRQAVLHPGRYNPLFVHGRPGVGKTLYLQTLAAAYERRGKKVLLLRGFEFMNQYTSAVQSRTYETFYRSFGGLDLLCIDDVQYLEGKDRTQETFQNIFNVLYDSGAQIALGSDRAPAAITGMMDALVSRFTWGLVVELQPPSEATRRQIVDRWNTPARVSQSVAAHIAAAPLPSVRALEGVLMRLEARMDITACPVGLREVQEEIERSGESSGALELAQIERIVCEHFRISQEELAGRSRSLRVARPRQMAMYLAKKHAGTSYPAIGEYFGLKSHATVINACRRIEKLRMKDRQLSLDLEEIEKNLK